MAIGREFFEPYQGEQAFREGGRASRSRSAQLLLVAEQLSRPLGTEPPSGIATQAEIIDAPSIHSEIEMERLAELRREAVFSNRGRSYNPDEVAEIWSAVRATSRPEDAIALLGRSLNDPSPFARLSAIVGLLASERSVDAGDAPVDDYLLSRLFEEQYRSPNVTGALARDLFDRISTSNLLWEVPPPALSFRPSDTTPSSGPLSIGVHGTFSRYGESRVAPNHSFYEYLSEAFSPDLFPDEARYFRWSGRYSRHDRQKGARDLPLWLNAVGKARELDTVYAHSHGGNVALSAAAAGVQINFLVLLSVPPITRSPAEWATINQNVGYMFSLRNHLDRVVLIDLIASRLPAGKSLFATERSEGLDFPPEANVHTASPIGWFSHTSWLDRHIWQSTTIEAEVKNKYALTHPTTP